MGESIFEWACSVSVRPHGQDGYYVKDVVFVPSVRAKTFGQMFALLVDYARIMSDHSRQIMKPTSGVEVLYKFGSDEYDVFLTPCQISVCPSLKKEDFGWMTVEDCAREMDEFVGKAVRKCGEARYATK